MRRFLSGVQQRSHTEPDPTVHHHMTGRASIVNRTLGRVALLGERLLRGEAENGEGGGCGGALAAGEAAAAEVGVIGLPGESWPLAATGRRCFRRDTYGARKLHEAILGPLLPPSEGRFSLVHRCPFPWHTQGVAGR